jgi:hypothetical protein
MPVAVQGRLVSALMDQADKVRVAFGALSHQMERGADPVSFEHLQQARCIPRMGSIVEGQRNLAARPISLEQEFRIPAPSRLIVSKEG